MVTNTTSISHCRAGSHCAFADAAVVQVFIILLARKGGHGRSGQKDGGARAPGACGHHLLLTTLPNHSNNTATDAFKSTKGTEGLAAAAELLVSDHASC
jgi:hypothetical protein